MPDSGLLLSSARGECPVCAAPTMFDGPVRFAPSCRACGLDYGQFNVGDGPAAFLTLVIGAVVVVLALVVEFRFHPPLWVHPLIWTPVIVAAVIGGLRLTKGALLILEYRNRAREGRLVQPVPKATLQP